MVWLYSKQFFLSEKYIYGEFSTFTSTASYVKENFWQVFNPASQTVLLLSKSEERILKYNAT